MSGGGYSSNVYPNDKVVGILIMVFAAICNVAVGFLGVIGGGVLAAGGASAAAGAASNTGAAGAGAATGVVGAGIMVLSVILILMGVVGLAVGYGIMKSLRWGFLVGTILYGLGVLNSLAGLSRGGIGGIIGLLIVVALFVYCLMRLIGKLGPKPV